MNLKSIDEEAAACRARCAGLKIGDICLHVHHGMLAEALIEPIERRIEYILCSKPLKELALRLRLMGPPVIDDLVRSDAAYQKATAEWSKANAEWGKANAEWSKAYAEWEKAKAYAEWGKATAERVKAKAERVKAKAERAKAKATAEWSKAYAEREKATAEWEKAYQPHYARRPHNQGAPHMHLMTRSMEHGCTIFVGEAQ